jgi:hypothetical protein
MVAVQVRHDYRVDGVRVHTLGLERDQAGRTAIDQKRVSRDAANRMQVCQRPPLPKASPLPTK